MWHPKIENEVEDWFYHELQKRTSANIIPQYEVPVGYSPYRLDFLVKVGSVKIGVEVDGKDYHETSEDSLRDERILSEYNDIKAIIRFEAHDLYYNAPVTTLFFCRFFPSVIVRSFEKTGMRHISETIGRIVEELSGADVEYYSNIEKARESAYGYLKTQGVQQVLFKRIEDQYGYEVYSLFIDFIPSDKEDEYMMDMEYGREVDPLDYTNRKETTVKVMRNFNEQ